MVLGHEVHRHSLTACPVWSITFRRVLVFMLKGLQLPTVNGAAKERAKAVCKLARHIQSEQ